MLNQDGSFAQISTKTENFYTELKNIFHDEIQNNILKIKDDLSIEFIDQKLLFKTGEYKLNKIQKKFIDKFCTKIIPFLNRYQKYISTLEVNGHTSSEWGSSRFQTSYLNNERLSMGRAYETLSYMFQIQDTKTQIWLAKVLKGSGLAFSKKVLLDNVEYKQKSRRVSFKIILNK
jgi:flagellar motor protein MotB